MNESVPYRLRYVDGGVRVEWVEARNPPFSEPFFEDTVSRLRRERPAAVPIHTSLENLSEGPTDTLKPTALLFHVSRCGSTLLSQMLAALPQTRVIAEPPIIDDILQTAHRIGAADCDRIGWLRGAVSALAGCGPPIRRFYVKLDCWHLFSLTLFRQAFPGTPMIFVHRHPVPVLVSLMRIPSRTLIRGTVTPEQLGISAMERDSLTPEAHAAAILGAFYRTAIEHSSAFLPVDYGQLPDAVWDAETMPGGPFTSEERLRLEEAARFDAKNPTRPFIADADEKQRSASPEIRKASARWAESHYRTWLGAQVAPLSRRSA